MSASPPQEGWAVSARLPLIAMVAIIALLTVALLIAGMVYRNTLRKKVEPPPIQVPPPRLELTQTPPNLDRQDTHQPAPAGLDRAMRDTAAQGNSLWQGARP